MHSQVFWDLGSVRACTIVSTTTVPSFNFSKSCFSGEESFRKRGSVRKGGAKRVEEKAIFLASELFPIINRRFKKPSSAKRCINAFSLPPFSFQLLLIKLAKRKVGKNSSITLLQFHGRNSIINHFRRPSPTSLTRETFSQKKRRHAPNWI